MLDSVYAACGPFRAESVRNRHWRIGQRTGFVSARYSLTVLLFNLFQNSKSPSGWDEDTAKKKFINRFNVPIMSLSIAEIAIMVE